MMAFQMCKSHIIWAKNIKAGEKKKDLEERHGLFQGIHLKRRILIKFKEAFSDTMQH
jgi:hypothetical protein